MLKPRYDTHMGKYKINEMWRSVAETLCAKYQEFSHIDVDDIVFVDNLVATGMSRGTTTYAKTILVSERWQEIIYQLTGHVFCYCVEFYKLNTLRLSRAQMVMLLYHELRHIGIDGKIIPHQVEEWHEVLEGVGHDWTFSGKTIPDLLSDSVDWDKLGVRRKLMNEPKEGLRVVK